MVKVIVGTVTAPRIHKVKGIGSDIQHLMVGLGPILPVVRRVGQGPCPTNKSLNKAAFASDPV
jgi:hypothetical protein